MVSDQAPEYPSCWGTALMRLQRNLGPQPWSCPGHLMHPADSLALSSNPHYCPCPRVREQRIALGWFSNPQGPAGIWQGRAWIQHHPSWPAPCSAFTLLFCFIALELPACPKRSCHVRKNTHLFVQDNSGIACVRALINTDAPNFMKGLQIFP